MDDDTHFYKVLTYEMMEEIYSELDVMKVSFKILKQVIGLIRADRASLFLVEGAKGKEVLVSKLFDIQQDTGYEDSLRNESNYIFVPITNGIVGRVASTKLLVNIKDAYSNPDFCKDVDVKVGYETRNILCLPVLNPNNEVIGVISAINKLGTSKEKAFFSREDEDCFTQYARFCALALTNSQLHEKSVNVCQRIEVTLQMAKRLFEKHTKVEDLMHEILTGTSELIQCKQCHFVLLKTEGDELPKKDRIQLNFTNTIEQSNQVENPNIEAIYKLENPKDGEKKVEKLKSLEYPDIINLVMQDGKPINIPIVAKSTLSATLAPSTQSLLCIPIFCKEKLIAMVEFIDKNNGFPFNNYDLEAFELLAVFYGLGISNVRYYEKSMNESYQNEVSLEILTYHIFPTDLEVQRTCVTMVPNASVLMLESFNFDDELLTSDELVIAVLRMFIDAKYLTRFNINYRVLCKFVIAVKNNYRQVIYHNWRHAFNVAQSMYAILRKTNNLAGAVSDLHGMALIVACLCHDLDHRGTNNQFQQTEQNALQHLYGSSIMEYHHINQFLMILNFDGCNIFYALSEKQKQEAMDTVRIAILDTDLGNHFKIRGNFIKTVEQGHFNIENKCDLKCLNSFIMTACDLSAITKPWRVQKRVAELVAQEFFYQGDLEREKGNQVPEMMDREKAHKLPDLQVRFIDRLCISVYTTLVILYPQLKQLVDGCTMNREQWVQLAKGNQFNMSSPAPHQLQKISTESLGRTQGVLKSTPCLNKRTDENYSLVKDLGPRVVWTHANSPIHEGKESSIEGKVAESIVVPAVKNEPMPQNAQINTNSKHSNCQLL
ncbi:Sperm phosphodiesterase 5 isoform X2 [Oopsacas minuta]|uniref:Phosphodiesterase n=1 Tax=Oopsacas minuta TaxID=111878 RepID=A0AAV7KJY7_9METZ|nr:Sperm phosphodiesterase 5 isoform X2 [Oopsacas minuta]